MTLILSTRWRVAAMCAIAITFGEVVAATAQPQRAAFGAFRMRTARMGGTLWIHSLSPSRFDIEVVTRTLGAPAAHGSFARGDALLDDWTYFGDWTLSVMAGERVRVDVRGGRTRSILCERYDAEVTVLDGDRVLAHDDDGGGALNARASFTAPRDGTVTVRVTEHDPWSVEGEYAVRAMATSPPYPATQPSPHP